MAPPTTTDGEGVLTGWPAAAVEPPLVRTICSDGDLFWTIVVTGNAGLITAVLVVGLMTDATAAEAGLTTVAATEGLRIVVTAFGGMFWVCSELGMARMTVVAAAAAPAAPAVRTKRIPELAPGCCGGAGGAGGGLAKTAVGLAQAPVTTLPAGCEDTTSPVREL